MTFLSKLILSGTILFLFNQCTIHDKNFDNPVDFRANKEKGILSPTLVFYPKTQTISLTDSIVVGSFIVFENDSLEPFTSAHIQMKFPKDLIQLDTILPGLFITDTNQSTPLFVYSFDSLNTIDIFTYFLDTNKVNILGTGHLADIVFNPLVIGSDSISYNLNECSMFDEFDENININGTRAAEIIIQ